MKRRLADRAVLVATGAALVVAWLAWELVVAPLAGEAVWQRRGWWPGRRS